MPDILHKYSLLARGIKMESPAKFIFEWHLIMSGFSLSNTWWRHQMETFSALLAICAGNSPVLGEFPAQKPVTRSFDVFLENGWVNNRQAGDLRRYRAHYDVIVMT